MGADLQRNAGLDASMKEMALQFEFSLRGVQANHV